MNFTPTGNLSDSSYNYNTDDAEESLGPKLDRYNENKSHFLDKHPVWAQYLQQVIDGKKKSSPGEHKSEPRKAYNAYIRTTCQLYFSRKLLIRQQPWSKKQRFWKDFKASPFGPLR